MNRKTFLFLSLHLQTLDLHKVIEDMNNFMFMSEAGVETTEILWVGMCLCTLCIYKKPICLQTY